MIANPHNDRECLDAITEQIAALVRDRDPELVAIAEPHEDTESLVAWIRTLPQRDDEGLPCDGPKVEACRPAQRLRVPADDPNCVERAATYLGAAELIDPGPVRRLATTPTSAGLHTYPTEDGEPVILDPQQSRNALRAGLFRAQQTRNGRVQVAISPSGAVDWIADLATEPAVKYAYGARRVRNGRRALHAALRGDPLCMADLGDVVFVLALAAREARVYGPSGVRIVTTTARAIDQLDREAAQRWMARNARNAPELRVGRYHVRPNLPLLGALGRVGGRLGYKVGVEALRAKLDQLGISTPVLRSIEQEMNREGLSLGPLATPPPMLGSLAALTPEALAGRWLASRV